MGHAHLEPESQELPAAILNRLPEGCLLLDADWTIRFSNAAAARHMGLDPASLEGRSFLELLPGVEATFGFNLMQRCLENGVPRHFTASLPGTQRLTFTVEPAEGGLFLRTWLTRPRLRRALATPPLTRPRPQQPLTTPEISYRTLIGNLNAGFHLGQVVRHANGEPDDIKLLDCNRHFLNYFGFKKEDVVGRVYRELWPFLDQEWYTRELQVINTGLPAHFEMASRVTSVVWEVFAFCPAFETIAIFSIEISERKQNERKALALNEQYALRTAILEESVQELNAFGSTIAHDLKAPLRHITGFADLLAAKEMASLSDQGRHYLTTIRDSAANMVELLDHLVALSRTGGKAMRLGWVDLNALVEGVINALEPEQRDREVHWEKAPLPMVVGDGALLREVFTNLLSNALKFTRERPYARIQIDAQEEPTEFILSVRDNGAGFDPRQAHRLFSVFQRLHSDRRFPGSGIGLASVKRSIRRHGGRVWAEPIPEGGAAFHFALPRTTLTELPNGPS